MTDVPGKVPERRGMAFRVALCGALVLIGFASFFEFFRALAGQWVGDPIFSYGILIPLISGFMIWQKSRELSALERRPWNPGLIVVIIGCVLQVMGTLSGILLVSGVALITILIGLVVFLWGKKHLRLTWSPLVFLILMVPWPSYTMGEVSWRLQGYASTAGAGVLQLLGVTVFQDGNLLILPNYVMQVKEACSGTHSLFALLSLGVILGYVTERLWTVRLLLIAVAPMIALLTNVVRIVGTGVAARWWGGAAAEDTLHSIWGILVFLLGVSSLLAIQRASRWLVNRFESQSSSA